MKSLEMEAGKKHQHLKVMGASWHERSSKEEALKIIKIRLLGYVGNLSLIHITEIIRHQIQSECRRGNTWTKDGIRCLEGTSWQAAKSRTPERLNPKCFRCGKLKFFLSSGCTCNAISFKWYHPQVLRTHEPQDRIDWFDLITLQSGQVDVIHYEGVHVLQPRSGPWFWP